MICRIEFAAKRVECVIGYEFPNGLSKVWMIRGNMDSSAILSSVFVLLLKYWISKSAEHTTDRGGIPNKSIECPLSACSIRGHCDLVKNNSKQNKIKVPS